MHLIWGSEKQKYFCQRGWTGGGETAEVICPSGRFVAVRSDKIATIYGREFLCAVIPGRAKREPGIHKPGSF